MRVLFILLLLIVSILSYRSKRLRRQEVPSEHVHVYAIESDINSEGGTVVDSGENRIDYTERDLNGSLWSDHSLLRLNEMDTSSNASAERAEAFLSLQGAQIHSQGSKADLYIVTQRATNGFSYTEHVVYGGANFSYDDGLMSVQGIGGQRATLQAETWSNDVPRSVSFEAESLPNGERELRIEAIDKPYHAVICFVGAMVYFQYAGHYVKMDPSYQFIEIWTDKYTITVKTEQAPFNVTMDRNEIVVLLKAENTRVCVYVNGVTIQAGQLAKNGGTLSIGGKLVAADGVMITALKTDLDMTNEGKVNSDTKNSFIMINTNNHKVGLTARHHNLKVNDGIPHIVLDPGMSIVEITTNHGTFEISALMGPFVPPADKFSDIGPFQNQGHGGYGPPPNMSPPLSAAAPPPPPSIEEALPPPIPISMRGPPGMDVPPPPQASLLPPPPPTNGLPPGLAMLGAGFAADLPPPNRNQTKKISDDAGAIKNKTVVTSIIETSNDKPNVSNTTTKLKKTKIPLDLLKPGFAVDLPQSNRNETGENKGSNSTKTIDDTDTITKVDVKKIITDTFKDTKKNKIDPNVIKVMAADVSPLTTTTPSTTTMAWSTTTATPITTATTPTTTATTTTITPTPTTTTSSTTTTTTTTTSVPTTTTTLSPMEELRKLKEEMMNREKKYREWQEEQTSNDGDGDEHVEEFTYPNGTTVHRVVKTRRRITTTVIHKHREEIKETSTNGTSKDSKKSSVSISSSTVKPLTTTLDDLFASSVRTRPPVHRKGTLAPGAKLPPVQPL